MYILTKGRVRVESDKERREGVENLNGKCWRGRMLIANAAVWQHIGTRVGCEIW